MIRVMPLKAEALFVNCTALLACCVGGIATG